MSASRGQRPGRQRAPKTLITRGEAAWGGRPLNTNYARHALCILDHASKLANKPSVFPPCVYGLFPTYQTNAPSFYMFVSPLRSWCCPTLPIQRIFPYLVPCCFEFPMQGSAARSLTLQILLQVHAFVTVLPHNAAQDHRSNHQD